MRKKGSKAKKGKKITCPRCKYSWKSKQIKKGREYICCSRCKRYFKIKKNRRKRK